MIRTSLFAIPAALVLAACTVETQSPEPSTTQSPITSPSNGGTAKPEVAFSCSGQVTRRDVGLSFDVGVRCVGGGPNVDCGGAAPACAAQDVAFTYPPPATDCDMGQKTYVWNGSACTGHKIVGSDGNLVCKGNDCEKTFRAEVDCLAAYSACPR